MNYSFKKCKLYRAVMQNDKKNKNLKVVNENVIQASIS